MKASLLILLSIALTLLPSQFDRKAIASPILSVSPTPKTQTLDRAAVDAVDLNLLVLNIASAYAEVGQIDKAIEVAQTIADNRYRALALNSIVKTLAEAGEIDRALEVSQTIADREVQLWATTQIVEALASDGDFPQALELMQTITDDERKAWVLRSTISSTRQRSLDVQFPGTRSYSRRQSRSSVASD
ncbi:hypothetical protein IQ235_18675 [Oscillatoriales cyanobacterium LEGE 11467]|uniref:Tetratricopeptide repeat protein n=1 Tax=Zarconia navalis LEGE 11467 TaxID=1828826 RepID=A0A928Z8S1_9CYAN|nr:hypothetical protein [Zarconia navalis]MBE9042787.1 hypothetical protein [Zarconia navalis LEGE 11467]